MADIRETYPTDEIFVNEFLGNMQVVVPQERDSLDMADLMVALEEAWSDLDPEGALDVLDFEAGTPGLLPIVVSGREEQLRVLETALDEGYAVQTTILGVPVTVSPHEDDDRGSDSPDGGDNEPRVPVVPLISGAAVVDPVEVAG